MEVSKSAAVEARIQVNKLTQGLSKDAVVRQWMLQEYGTWSLEILKQVYGNIWLGSWKTYMASNGVSAMH